MQTHHIQSEAVNEQHSRKSHETTLWNRIKHQFSSNTPDREEQAGVGKHYSTPLIYIEPHVEDSKMQANARRQHYDHVDGAYLSPHRTPVSPRLNKSNQSKSDQMLSQLLKDQLQLAYSDHQNNVRCAQSQAALRHLHNSQPRLELSPSSSRHASPSRMSKSQNSSPSISRRSHSPLARRLTDTGSSGSENSCSSNHSAPPAYYQVGRSKSCTPSRTQSPIYQQRPFPDRISHSLSHSNSPTRQSSSRHLHQLHGDPGSSSVGPSELVKQAHINLLWAFIYDAVKTAHLDDFDDSDPKQWWRKLFQTLKAMHGRAKASSIAGQLMGNPLVLNAIQKKLAGMVGEPSGYVESLPKSVQRRIKALKKLQFECTKIEAEFYEEIHKLECRFADRYSPIFTRRKEIITGEYEPNDEDCEWPSDSEDDDDEEEGEVEKKKKLAEPEEEKIKTKGIASFWPTTLKNVEVISGMIQEQDEPVVNSLTDVRLSFSSDPMGFSLHFDFDDNDYFTDKVLTKHYTMRSAADMDDPFGFEGPEIVSCKGCTIHWKEGKNITVSSIKKKQKNAKTGSTRMVTKEVQNDSFFNFFSPPEVDEEEELDEDTESLLQADYQIGHFIRERLVPNAVLYFTGEAVDDDDEDNEDEDDDEGEDDDEDDEDEDPDYDPKKDPAKAKDCRQQ